MIVIVRKMNFCLEWNGMLIGLLEGDLLTFFSQKGRPFFFFLGMDAFTVKLRFFRWRDFV